MKNKTLTTIIIAGNEEKMIQAALESVKFSQEVVLVAANSSDQTVQIAKKINPDIVTVVTKDEYGKNFSKWRNLGLEQSTSDWVFYLDADERVTDNLQKEIQDIINSTPSDIAAYAIPRANYFLGKRVKHGGTYPDYVVRLFDRSHISCWEGFLHEQPKIKGKVSYLKSDLLHFTHRDLTSMLEKTLIWTQSEAEALHRANHPPVVWWRFIRMILTKVWERLIVQKMYLDGTVGWISVIFEAFDTFIIYARLWELQQNDHH